MLEALASMRNEFLQEVPLPWNIEKKSSGRNLPKTHDFDLFRFSLSSWQEILLLGASWQHAI